MTLTSSQQSALDQFMDFVNSDENNVFLLKGSAGTGKTTLLEAMVNSLGEGWKCILMAPTGRAAYILSKKTACNASTIHRTIYTIENGLEDNGSGQLIFGIRLNQDPISRTIYFVDEASMISDNYNENEMFKFGSGYLLRDLMGYCGARKIVFVGDYAQLPPVGQSISPALSADYLKEKYSANCQEVMMKEVVRQIAESSVLTNALSVRDAIESNSFNEFHIIYGQDVVKSESIIDNYKEQTEGEVDEDAIVIAYSNKQVLDYNLAIRKYLFPNNQEKLCPGDLLLISQNNYSNSVELFNGTIVKVLACASDGMIEKRQIRFYTSETDEYGEKMVRDIELSFRQVKIETPEHKIEECLILDNFLTEELGIPPKEYRQALMADFNNRMTEFGVKKNSDFYQGHLKTDKYLHALICKYGYAITCHKAQGGEWQKVFVDMNRLGGKQNSDYFRWAYTAITRSNGLLWLFASPLYNAISNMPILPISRINKVIYYVPNNENTQDWYYRKVNSSCKLRGISCSENRNYAYQHIFYFEKDNHKCTFRLWFDVKGNYTKRILQSTNDKVFSDSVLELLTLSFIPDKLPYKPNGDFASILHESIVEIADELGISILNICQERWKDIYYFKTTPYESSLTFNYNAKNVYSSAIPQSTGGVEDKLLEIFCEKIRQCAI